MTVEPSYSILIISDLFIEHGPMLILPVNIGMAWRPVSAPQTCPCVVSTLFFGGNYSSA